MILAGKSIQVGPGISVGFDDASRPTLSVAGGDGPEARPSPERVMQAVGQARDVFIQHAALLTLWLMASSSPQQSGIVAPTPGDLAAIRSNGGR